MQKVTASLYGMSGDLQGIAGQDILAMPALGDGDDELLPIKPRIPAPRKNEEEGDIDEY